MQMILLMILTRQLVDAVVRDDLGRLPKIERSVQVCDATMYNSTTAVGLKKKLRLFYK
jgi:hypothetical protein